MKRQPGSSKLRVGLAQFKPTKGDVASNLSQIREVVSEQAGAVDLLVFPETSLTGYFLEGGLPRQPAPRRTSPRDWARRRRGHPMWCSVFSSGIVADSTTASYI